jgi:hypothetical protein
LYIPHIWVAVGLLLALTTPLPPSTRHAKKTAPASR